MKTNYKYIHFEKYTTMNMWECINNKGGILGIVEWYPTWKQWVFESDNDLVVFSCDCLDDISHFIKQLNEVGNENT